MAKGNSQNQKSRGFLRYDPMQKYQVNERILALSMPRRVLICPQDISLERTESGVRKTAINLKECPDRLKIAALPYNRVILATRKQYRRILSEKQMNNLMKLLETSNGSIYAKLANCVLDLKKTEKKKKPWTEAEWRKHMEYIGALAEPREPPIPEEDEEDKKKNWCPLEELMPRILQLSTVPPSKQYKRLSQRSFYRDPTKVEPKALKYVITERVKKLAEPRALITE